jgi:hypothetical protein
MVLPSISAPNFVTVTSYMGILFHILRRDEVFTLWSFFFLSFMCFANVTLGILSFWVSIHLSVSADHVCSFVIGLPHSYDWQSVRGKATGIGYGSPVLPKIIIMRKDDGKILRTKL